MQATPPGTDSKRLLLNFAAWIHSKRAFPANGTATETVWPCGVARNRQRPSGGSSAAAGGIH